MDDVVIKTRAHDEFIPDLEETFNSLHKIRRATRKTTQFHC
jgi:hypothetical protein